MQEQTMWEKDMGKLNDINYSYHSIVREIFVIIK